MLGSHGADVVYDPVGGDYAEPALRAMAWRGRYLVVGFTAGIPKLPFNLPLLKGCSIVGVFWGAFAGRNPGGNRRNLLELLGWLKEGKLKPYISATYPLEGAAQALQEIMDRKVKGKVVLLT